MKTFVIAEAGSCHDGSLLKALQLVEAARAVGADACKFQFWSSAARLADRRRAPNHYRDIYRRYQLRPGWLKLLAEACQARTYETLGMRPIEFMCSTYLPEDIAVVDPFVRRFKVASFEAGDEDFVEAHRPFGKPVIISTGMADSGPRWVRARGWSLLHCVSSYPAPLEQMNLRVLSRPTDDYGSDYDGLSDHSRHPLTGALAVAAGARILEAHLRLEDTDPANPDYATAFAPAEFAEYVRHIRFAERVMGDGVKQLQVCEQEMAPYRVRS